MPQSWAYNATGERHGPLWLDEKIKDGDMLSFPLEISPLKENKLDIEINTLFDQINKGTDAKTINHIAIAYGVWGRVSMKGRKFTSKLNVDKISLSSKTTDEHSSMLKLNGQALIKTDTELQFGYHYKKDKNQDIKKQ